MKMTEPSKRELKKLAQVMETNVQREGEAPHVPTVAPPVRHYRTLVAQGYVIAAAIGFAVLALLAHTVLYFTFDLTITREVQTFSPPWFSDLMLFLSTLGYAPQSGIFAGLVIAYLWVVGLPWEAAVSLFAGGGVSLLGGLAKLLVARPRPSADLIHVYAQLSSLSFPSGHVLMATGFVGFLWFLVYTLLKRSWRRTLGLIFFGLIIGLMGLSRIYLGQHWASDVLGAYLLGSLWLILSIQLYRWGKPRFFVGQPLARETRTSITGKETG